MERYVGVRVDSETLKMFGKTVIVVGVGLGTASTCIESGGDIKAAYKSLYRGARIEDKWFVEKLTQNL